MNEHEMNVVDNLLLNLSAGLLPYDLSESEVNLLKERFGNNWFIELGYRDKSYKRSKYDNSITKEETDV